MKKYSKPNLETFTVNTIDVITTSDNSALNNLAQNLAVENAKTEAYDFEALFGN